MNDVGGPVALEPLEIATGTVYGPFLGAPPLPDVDVNVTTREALEAVILEALLRPPCLVSFSGGLDSSAVLALAALVARQHGLALPVPVTLRFPTVESSEESDWQQRVVDHLRLTDWLRIELAEELDVVGPVAQKVLSRHGLLWPVNTHFHEPMLEAAAGGSLVTGVGGDELTMPGWVWDRVNRVLSRQARPTPKDLVRIAIAYGPKPIRRIAIERRLGQSERLPWLTDFAQQAVRAQAREDMLSEPVRWDVAVRAFLGSRYQGVAVVSLGLLASDHDCLMVHPFTSGAVVNAAARERGRFGFASRRDAVEWLAGDVLPPTFAARTSKAGFDEAFWTTTARRFAAEWDGTGLDDTWVDQDALRTMWLADVIDGRTLLLMQSLWIRQHCVRTR